MARIQLRDTSIYIQDGLAGTALVNELSTGRLNVSAVTTDTEGINGSGNEIQRVHEYLVPVSGGTFTLSIDLIGGTDGQFTTLPIPYNAAPSAVEDAIDAAATLAGTAPWNDGDIVVTATATNLTDGDLILTYSGASVEELDQSPASINTAGLIWSGNTVPAITIEDGTPATDDEIQVIPQAANVFSGGTYTLAINLNVGVTNGVFTTGPIPYNADATAITTAINTAADNAGATPWNDGDIVVTGGPLNSDNITLTYSGSSVDELDHGAAVINGLNLVSGTLNNATDLDVDTVSLNTDDTDLIPVGARFTVVGEAGSPVHTVTGRTGNPTTNITFTPAIAAGSSILNNANITFLPQRIEVKIGDGDLSWTEAREFIYDLDRDLLDTVREGAEQPVEVELNFVFEYVTTESGQAITPIDALKRIGEASEWVSSSADLCEPYAVDLYVIHQVPCGTDQDQDFLFQDFRWESLDYSIQDAAIAVSGRCNISSVITTRGDF